MLLNKNFLASIILILIFCNSELLADDQDITKTGKNKISDTESIEKISDTNQSDNENKGDLNNVASKYNLSDWNGSVFFNDTEIESIKAALFKLKNTVKEQQENKEVENSSPLINSIVDNIVIKKEELPKESPSFYLNSILYKSNDKWIIWLNKKEIRSENNQSINIDEFNDIKVIKVDSKQATIEWRSNFLNRFCPDINDIIKNKNDPIYKNIDIDYDNKKISFTIKVNQSFVSKDMLIKEGYVGSSIIENNSGNESINKQNRK